MINDNKRMIELYQEADEGKKHLYKFGDKWVPNDNGTFYRHIEYKLAPEELKCTDGNYILARSGRVKKYHDTIYDIEIGNTYKTEEEAKRASALRINREIINNLVRQGDRGVFFILHSEDENQFTFTGWDQYAPVGSETCSRSHAEKIVKALNAGEVEGIRCIG